MKRNKTVRTLSQRDAPAAGVPASISRPADWMFLQPGILDQMHDAVIVTDLEGNVTGCNRAVQRLYGYAADELIGQNVTLLYPPEEQQFLAEALIPTVRREGLFHGELRNRSRAGDYLYVHLSVTLLRDGEGHPVGMVGFSIDVTAQKLGQLAMRHLEDGASTTGELEPTALPFAAGSIHKNEELLRLGMQVSRVGLAEVDYRTGLNHLTAQAARLFGLGEVATAVPREVVHATFHPADRDELLGRITACLDPQGAGWFDMDHRVVWSSGEVRWLRVRKQVTFEGEGAQRRPYRANLAAFDITPEKHAIHQVQRSEQRLRLAASATNVGVWEWNVATGTLHWDEHMFRIYGLAPTSDGIIRYSSWLACVHPEDRDAQERSLQETVRRAGGSMREFRIWRAEEQGWRFIRSSETVRLTEEGIVESVIGTNLDCTVQKRSEEALRQSEKLAAVGKLASSISHEINNPLEAVTNLLYLLAGNDRLDRPSREYVKAAQEEIARISEITTQTLRFHRQSSNAVEVRLSDILDSVLAFFKPRFTAANVDVRREYEATQPLTCYSGEIRQSLTNIIGNSLDAMPNGGRLRARLRSSRDWTTRQRAGVRITIGDTGTGISPENQSRIFEPFFTTKGMSGTGLGMWITRDLILKHGGTLSVRSSASKPASGTVMSIFLPYEFVKRTKTARPA